MAESAPCAPEDYGVSILEFCFEADPILEGIVLALFPIYGFFLVALTGKNGALSSGVGSTVRHGAAPMPAFLKISSPGSSISSAPARLACVRTVLRPGDAVHHRISVIAVRPAAGPCQAWRSRSSRWRARAVSSSFPLPPGETAILAGAPRAARRERLWLHLVEQATYCVLGLCTYFAATVAAVVVGVVATGVIDTSLAAIVAAVVVGVVATGVIDTSLAAIVAAVVVVVVGAGAGAGTGTHS